MMNEREGRELAGIPKIGDPREQWVQPRPNVLRNEFGVMYENGQTIKGVFAEFEVFVSPGLGNVKYVFSLKRFHIGRAYQLEINTRKSLRPTDHAYSHEHYGEVKYVAKPTWANCSFQEAVKRFCENSNLKLSVELPEYQDFKLK